MAKKSAWINKRIPSTVVALVLAIVFVACAVMEHIESAHLLEHGVQVEAEVTEEGSGRFATTWVRFEAGDEGVVEVELLNQSGPAPVGSVVLVVYDPADPTRNADARGLGSFLSFAGWWATAAVSLVLAGLTGFGVLDWERRSRRR